MHDPLIGADWYAISFTFLDFFGKVVHYHKGYAYLSQEQGRLVTSISTCSTILKNKFWQIYNQMQQLNVWNQRFQREIDLILAHAWFVVFLPPEKDEKWQIDTGRFFEKKGDLNGRNVSSLLVSLKLNIAWNVLKSSSCERIMFLHPSYQM